MPDDPKHNETPAPPPIDPEKLKQQLGSAVKTARGWGSFAWSMLRPLWPKDLRGKAIALIVIGVLALIAWNFISSLLNYLMWGIGFVAIVVGLYFIFGPRRS